jgi:hypothetical protein
MRLFGPVNLFTDSFTAGQIAAVAFHAVKPGSVHTKVRVKN